MGEEREKRAGKVGERVKKKIKERVKRGGKAGK